MNLSIRQLAAGGAVLAVALVLWLVWAMWPAGTEPGASLRPTRRTVERRAPPPPIPEPAERPIPPPPDPEEVLAELGIDPKETPNCALVVTWASQRVPGWSITKNMEAQGMMFNEKELACLTGASTLPGGMLLPGGIQEWADNHVSAYND